MIGVREGFDRDEYPPAVGRGRGPGLERGRNPRGWKADVRYVPSSENRSHGASRSSVSTNQASVMIPSGSYSLAVCGTGFATTNEYGDDGSDTYMIWLWPGRILQTRVLKDGLTRAL